MKMKATKKKATPSESTPKIRTMTQDPKNRNVASIR
jgi:hypothetical protein